jgi:uncharacterized protein
MKLSTQNWPAKRKSGTILQLYSDLLQHMQGTPPENMYVVVPWSDFDPQLYRFADYGAYYRLVKRRLELALEVSQRSGYLRHAYG